MNKPEINQLINKAFHEHALEHFPDYYIDNQSSKNKIYLVFPDGSVSNTISYDINEHTISVPDWCNENVKQDVECLGEFIKEELKKFENTLKQD